jgi:hypothetical protein
MRDSAQPRSGHLTGRAWEAHILYGSSTDEQRSSSGKDRQPGGLFSGGHLAALLLSHRALEAMLLRRALPAARQKTARPFPILIWALSRFCFNEVVPQNRHDRRTTICR